MAPAEIVGLIASIIAIFEVGYIAGKWRADKRRRSTLDEAVSARVRQVLGAAEIVGLACDAREVRPGQTIRISYEIVSKAEFRYQVWLGASIVGTGGVEYFDRSEDKEITLDPGQNSYSRYLTVSGDAPVGAYDVYGAIWLGERATPVNSIRLARLQSATALQVKDKVAVSR